MQDPAAQATQEAFVSAQTYLDEVARRLHKAGAEVRAHTGVAKLSAAAILDEARQCEADLIVMATHGQAGLARLLLGSVTGKMLCGAETPMLVYRPQGHYCTARRKPRRLSYERDHDGQQAARARIIILE